MNEEKEQLQNFVIPDSVPLEEVERLKNLYIRWVNPYEIILIITPDGTRSWQIIQH